MVVNRLFRDYRYNVTMPNEKTDFATLFADVKDSSRLYIELLPLIVLVCLRVRGSR
jgi:hypothetical protein